ncbi:phospho-N-acetylmuramoyl-pentapeptide-transferase [Bacteroidetes bacterium endosymbiont of Geopemphigus sp.]|uniref:phospho-N-acetylmuramoyl-pentapeptide- transferase n=1 Tax=Bacteroidetes bacterium endosymbiont of Geopemphigus sp. TaxID=2047937 RepID=UPI000CD0BE76|nr:phospho-N-acetylmuramoyl-pentapeptide-transferase [Bacteroidetes bacterium endosymbiont of Geopemphigus sp.]
MIYHLFEYLKKIYNFPGINLMQYISFRAGIALILSLAIALFYGKKTIRWLHKKQMGECVRDLGLSGQKEKEGTPTMGGLIIIGATLLPTVLFARLGNVYITMLIATLLWMGFIGFIDDYIKVFRKKKDGLKGSFKLTGQVFLGIFIGAMMYFHPQVTIKEKIYHKESSSVSVSLKSIPQQFSTEKYTIKTTVPFFKNNEFNYTEALQRIDPNWSQYAWIIFIPIVILIIAAVSNGANLTDGIDGLVAGTSSIVVGTLALLAWVSGNFIFSNYLNIMYIPEVGEMVIFSASFVGALIGFMWYNTYPAQVFMGDTGSLTIGGVIAVLAIATRKELMLPLLCGVFLIENLSVILQVVYFKYTKRKSGKGKRIFLMSPLHHHFQKKGYHESKIVNRFLIIQIFLAVIIVISLKVR